MSFTDKSFLLICSSLTCRFFSLKFERQLVHIFTAPDFIMANYRVTDFTISLSYCSEDLENM